jgi:hypothetical protein
MKEEAKSGNSWAQRQVKAYKDGNKNRRCSFCDGKGHNRRTCSAKKEARVNMLQKTREFRKALLVAFKNIGLGNGTFLKGRYDWDTGLVFKIDWNAVSPFHLRTSPLYLRNLSLNEHSVSLTELFELRPVTGNSWSRITIASRCSELANFKPPENWCVGDIQDDFVKEAFDEAKCTRSQTEYWLNRVNSIINSAERFNRLRALNE